MLPLVSVIIPAFNAEETIADTLRSVVSQTYRNLEIIVVDDGSRDETAKIVSQLGNVDSRIKLIQQKNSGVAAARNAGLAASTGSLIAPLDADDLWHPQKIELQVANLCSSGEEAGLDYCWFVDIDEQSIIMCCNMNQFEGDVYEDLVLANFIGNSSVPLIRRELLEAAGGWDTSLRAAKAQGCEDWLLYLKIAERSRIVFTPAFLVGYRQLAQAMSRNVSQMSRSYELVMAQARLARPDITRSLFVKSGMDFDLYIAGMCWTSSRPMTALWFTLRSMARDPFDWRRNADVLRDLARRLLRRGRVSADAATEMPVTFHGLPFGALEPFGKCRLCQVHPVTVAAS